MICFMFDTVTVQGLVKAGTYPVETVRDGEAPHSKKIGVRVAGRVFSFTEFNGLTGETVKRV